jgi:hypothetical protein
MLGWGGESKIIIISVGMGCWIKDYYNISGDGMLNLRSLKYQWGWDVESKIIIIAMGMGCWIKDHYNISWDGILNQRLL